MFGWFRRQDGFEWRNYVRTTILIRREKRRQKLDEARLAALDGLKDAGRKGAEIGASGIEAAGRSALSLGARARAFLAGAAGATAAGIGGFASSAFAALKGGLGRMSGARIPLPRLDARRIVILLAVLAVAGGLALLTQLPLPRLDPETGMAVGMGIAALVVLAFASGLPSLEGLRELAQRIGSALPSAPEGGVRLPEVPPRVLYAGGAIAALAAAFAAGAWLTPWSASPGSSRALEAAAASGQTARRIEGRAIAKTGDTLRVDGTTIKLAGIEAPDRDQTCQRVGARAWPCGRAAAEALAKLVRGKDVGCDLGKVDSSGNQLATCRLGDADLADQLVRNGHVFAETGLFATYASAESAARNAKSGVWSGEIERPSAYRAKRWEEAKRAAPEGCPIKGQVASGARVYVLPWSSSYERIKIRASRGERWFCSEKEAIEAGWKPVERS